MTKKFTLFGMMLLLSVVSVFASGFELPKVDVARQQKMAAEVNTDLMMRPRGSVNSPFAKTPSLKMQKKQLRGLHLQQVLFVARLVASFIFAKLPSLNSSQMIQLSTVWKYSKKSKVQQSLPILRNNL